MRRLGTLAAVVLLVSSVLPLPAGATPVLTAAKSDLLVVDVDGDGVADPGDTLRYEVSLVNSGTTNASGARFDDTVDANTSIVSGSLSTTPIARQDVYQALGNTGISVPAASGLLANDADPDGVGGLPDVTVSAFDLVSSGLGTVSVAGDGSFTYTPAAGFEGTDTFSYTVVDGEGLNDTTTVVIVVSDPIWYIDGSSGGANLGTVSDPFTSIAAFQASGLPDSGDVVFLYGGTYTNGIGLSDDQILIGEGATASIAAIASISVPAFSTGTLPPTGGARPVLTTSAGDAITVASNNTIRGVDIGDTAGIGLAGVSIGSLEVSEVAITGTGGGVDLTNGATNVLLDELTASGTSAGIQLANVSGTFSVASGSISTTGAAAIDIAGNPSLHSVISLSSASSTSASRGISLIDTSGSLSIGGGTISFATDTGIYLRNTENVSLDGLTVTGSGNDGVYGQIVDNFYLTNATVSNNGNAVGESGMEFNGLTGTVSITNSTFDGNHSYGVEVTNSSGTIDALVVTGNTLSNQANESGFAYEGTGTATVTAASLSDNTVSNNDAAGFLFNVTQSGSADVTISGNTASGNDNFAIVTSNFSANVQFDISGNPTIAPDNGGIAVNMGAQSTSAGNLEGRISNNSNLTIPAGAYGAGIRTIHNGSGTMSVDIAGNTVHYNDGWDRGIHVQTRDGQSGTLNATLNNNTVNLASGFNTLHGINLVGGGAASTDRQTLCADVTGNTVNVSTFYSGLDPVRLRQRFGGSSGDNPFLLEGFAGNGTVAADVAGFIDSQNAGIALADIDIDFGGSREEVNYGTSVGCALPTLPAAATPSPFTPSAHPSAPSVAAPPSGIGPAGETTTPPTVNPANLAVDLGTLNPGQIVTVAFDVEISAGATATEVCNSGLLTGDNFADTPTNIVCTPVPQADLSIDKTGPSGDVDPGAGFSYTITVSNAGPSAAQDVEVTDVLPAGMAFVSTTGCAEDPNGVPTCSLGTIAAGGSTSYTVNVTAPSTDGQYTNTAAVASTTHDPDPTNNSIDETTDVVTPNLPPVADANGPYTVNEGSSVVLDASGSTDPEGGTLYYQWDLDGDNIIGETGAAALRGDEVGVAPSFSAAGLSGPALITVDVVVIDDFGLSDAATATVIVDNVAPTLGALSATNTNEGGASTLSGTIADPGTPDAFSLDVNWGDGSPVETFTYAAGTAAFSETHIYLDDDPSGTASDNYTVGVTLSDSDGDSDTSSTSVTVGNVAPLFSGVAVSPASVNENGSVSLSGTFIDPGILDSFTVAVDWGDGSPVESFAYPAGTAAFSETHQYLDDDPSGTSSDTYNVQVTVTDDDTGTDSVSAPTVTVNNVAPLVSSVAVSPATIIENGSVSLSGTFIDPGILDSFTVAVDWGDGSPVESFAYPAGTAAFSETHQYLDDDPSGTSSDTYNVQVTVTDDDTGADSVSAPTVTVNNAAPSFVSLGVTPSILEAGTVNLTGSFFDPGSLDSHLINIDWGDGNTTVLNPAVGVRDFASSHSYPDDDPSGTPADAYVITVTITDDDTGTVADSVVTLVNNVSPSLTLSTDSPVDEGGVLTLSGSITDPGVLDTFTAVVHWGDGSPIETLLLPAGTTSFTAAHTYAASGDYTILVGLQDDDLGSTSQTTEVEVLNLPPEVTISLASQTVQYSDGVADVLITGTDVVSDNPLTATAVGLPNGTSLSANGCSPNGQVTCTWTISGSADDRAGNYVATVTVADPDGAKTVVTHTITIEHEDAVVSFADTNPVAVQVATEGGSSGPFSLTVAVQELFPDLAPNTPYPGDIGLADVSMALIPVGPGGPVSGICSSGSVVGSGYDAVLTVTCDFDGVDVNTYAVNATVGGDYYSGAGEDVLVVFDPSLGFTTGGGWFYWPGTDDKTNFGYVMKYNKKGTNVKGNLLVIRHLDDGSIYRIKSNSLFGLAIGDDASVPMGWASFAGKATYVEPGWPDPVGNHEFRVYVEDRDEPGSGVDRFWLQVLDKDDNVIAAMSMDPAAVDNAVEISGGNIVVPHTPARGGGKGVRAK